MKNNSQKPLTLEVLASYNREVLFPWMQETFATKTELEDFKNKTLTSQDNMLKKLDILLAEKTLGEHQEKREKKMWAIIIKALQEHRILSSKQLEEISHLEIF